MVTGKSISLQGWTGPLASRNFKLPEFLDNRHMKEVKLSAEHSGRLYIIAGTPGTHVCYRLSPSQGDSTNGRIKLIKNPNILSRHRTRNLLAYSAIIMVHFGDRLQPTRFELHS